MDKPTTFEIYLAPAEHGEPIAASAPRDTRASGRGGTILVAEDEEAVRRLIVAVLEDCGYTVLEARDGEEALRVAIQYRGKIDLLLTDTVMPKMSGPTLSRQIRREQPEIRILYMSGYTDDAVVLRDILKSGAPFLQKPFEPGVLIRKVSEVLRGG